MRLKITAFNWQKTANVLMSEVSLQNIYNEG